MKQIVEFSNKLVLHPTFNRVIFILILLSATITGIETYRDLTGKFYLILRYLDQFIIWCFVVEIAIKIIAHGKKPWEYFKNPWNVFDFLIVSICLIPAANTHFFAVLRLLRVLRILRMITVFPKLRLIIGTLLKSIPSMGYIVLLIGILFYVYAILGVFIFGETDPMHFGDLHHAMVTLFKILTLEGWTDIMNFHVFGSIDNLNQQIISFWPFLYFASFILIGAMIVMNLFIGVIMKSMEESQQELTRELRNDLYKSKSTDELYKQVIVRLDELTEEIRNTRNNQTS